MKNDVITFSSSDEQKLMTSQNTAEDREPEMLTLRPEWLTEYIGQVEVVETLKSHSRVLFIPMYPRRNMRFTGISLIRRETTASS